MKNFISVIFILFSILLCGFSSNEKPYILLSSGNNAISGNTIRNERHFAAGQRIYFSLVAPKGYKKSGVRMQLSKQDEKTSNWGFSIIQSRDIYLDLSQKTYRDYLRINQNGHYILQFFYLNNKRYPFAHIEFMVH